MLEFWYGMPVLQRIYLVASTAAAAVISIRLMLLIFRGRGEKREQLPGAAGLNIFTWGCFVTFVACAGASGYVMMDKGIDAAIAVILSLVFGSAGVLMVALIREGGSLIKKERTADMINAVGLFARAETVLSPKGRVSVPIAGKRLYNARTEGEEVPPGSELIVTGVDGGVLVVRRRKDQRAV